MLQLAVSTLKHLRHLLLGIPLDGEPSNRDRRIRALKSLAPEHETFIEPETAGYPHLSIGMISDWIRSLFPFSKWLFKYQRDWIIGDLVAGFTIGIVIIPQGMAYAKLAELPVESGLYSSVMGVLVYWMFSTSKDITIGPVAVMSSLMGEIVRQAAITSPNRPGHVVASSLALISGCIIFALGLLRLGFVVDFISHPTIAAYLTSSAISIIAGQVPTMLGISHRLDTHAATYQIIIHTFQQLPNVESEAAVGLTALACLYGIRFGLPPLCRLGRMAQKTTDVLVAMRSIFVLVLYTVISYVFNRHHRAAPPISILGHIPHGLTTVALPLLDKEVIKTYASHLPAVLIVLVIEHMSIAKSFARINHYTISPSQELMAIGISNIFGPFLGAYPVTGSFSRTALNSKAGVRTPLSGIITAGLVLLTIYELTGVFEYIPNAALSAVIVHAVWDLIVWPPTAYQTIWRVSSWDGMLFIVGVFVAIFTSLELGIYTTIIASLAGFLFRLAHTNVQPLGTATVWLRGSAKPQVVWISRSGIDGTNHILVDTKSNTSMITVARLTGPMFYANASRTAGQLSDLIAEQRSIGLVLDLSSTVEIDSTAAEALSDLQESHSIPIVFCGLRSASVFSALSARGFGACETDGTLVGHKSHIEEGESVEKEEQKERQIFPLLPTDRPCFQIDIEHAVKYISKLNQSLTIDCRRDSDLLT